MSNAEIIKEFNETFWAKINKLCQDCTKSCKQSYKVTVCQCPSYEGIASKARRTSK